MIKKIISDNGPSFALSAFDKFLQQHSIKRYLTSSYNPSANGMAEAKVKEIKKYASLYPYYPQGWKACVHAAAELLNRTMNRSIGCSPLHMLTGKQTLLPADRELGITTESLLKLEQPLSADQQQAIRIAEQKRRNAHKRFRKFKVGDMILFSTGYKGKAPVVKGPVTIVRIIEKDGHAKTLLIMDDGKEMPIAVKNAVLYHERGQATTAAAGQ